MAGLHVMCRGSSAEVARSLGSAAFLACSGMRHAVANFGSPRTASGPSVRTLRIAMDSLLRRGARGWARSRIGHSARRHDRSCVQLCGTTCAPAQWQIRTRTIFVNESRRSTSRSYEMP